MFATQILAKLIMKPNSYKEGQIMPATLIIAPPPPWFFRPSDSSEMALNITREGFANFAFVQICKLVSRQFDVQNT